MTLKKIRLTSLSFEYFSHFFLTVFISPQTADPLLCVPHWFDYRCPVKIGLGQTYWLDNVSFSAFLKVGFGKETSVS